MHSYWREHVQEMVKNKLSWDTADTRRLIHSTFLLIAVANFFICVFVILFIIYNLNNSTPFHPTSIFFASTVNVPENQGMLKSGQNIIYKLIFSSMRNVKPLREFFFFLHFSKRLVLEKKNAFWDIDCSTEVEYKKNMSFTCMHTSTTYHASTMLCTKHFPLDAKHCIYDTYVADKSCE